MAFFATMTTYLPAAAIGLAAICTQVIDARSFCQDASRTRALLDFLGGTFGHHDHLLLFACCRDWFGSGPYTGYRYMAFCRDSSRTRAMPDNFGGDTKAFCLSDVTWQLADGTRSEGAQCLTTSVRPLVEVGYAGVPSRTVTMATNVCVQILMPLITAGSNSYTALSSVFVVLRGPTDVTTPLSVDRHSNGTVYLLTAVDVEVVM